ncbi:DUF397 domain-containing protein [Actinocorallia longicatena]|uniref:DUF397 domain-containing protein n=1 Tax=Actinocorallia longicatena TaxID=111803 RepID=A0ABP6Q171_9ACTN
MAVTRKAGSALRRQGALLVAGVPQAAVWRKASASSSGGCVELASASGIVYVQDSKGPDCATTLSLTAEAWDGLLRGIRARHG